MQVISIRQGQQPPVNVVLDRDRYLLGQGEGNDFSFASDTSLSRYHLLLERADVGWLAADLSGRGRTLLNGNRLETTVLLQPSDEIQAGQIHLIFAPEAEPPAAIEGLLTMPTGQALQATPEDTNGAVLKIFHHVSEHLEVRGSLARLENQVLDFMMELTGATDGLITRREKEELRRRLTKGKPGGLSYDLTRMALERRESLLVPCREGELGQMLVPLVEDNLTQGLIYLRKPGGFTECELSVAAIYASLAAAVLVRAELQEKLHRLAYYDASTGLPNRVRFLEHLQARLGGERPLALLLLRLDRLGLIRNSMGREFGDRLVVRLAEYLQPLVVGGQESLFRTDRSELALLIQDYEGSEALKARLRELDEILTASFWVADQQVYPAVSVGVLVTGPHYTRSEEVLRDAEIAAQRAAQQTESRFCLFEETMHRRLMRVQQVESGLRRALASSGQLSVKYQPIVRLATQQIEGFEVLARWNHPEFGVIEPSEFIPLAEETGLIGAVGRMVFEMACRQLAEWRRRMSDRALFMAVNVSPKQLVEADFLEVLDRVLQRTGVAPGDIRLEITESAMIEQPERTVAVLKQLKQLGVKLALDDLGTGYSSFQYLYKLPLDSLKIDRSFISAMRVSDETRQIVRFLTDLGHLLRLEIVAEGLESEADLELIQQVGCELGQGYLFGQPTTADRADRLLDSWPVHWQNRGGSSFLGMNL